MNGSPDAQRPARPSRLIPPGVSPRALLISLLVVVFAMINFGDKSVLGLAEIPLTRELHLSHAAYGLVASSFFLLFSIAALAVGFITNRIGSRWVLLALALAWSLAQIPLLADASVTALFASRIALGAAEGPAASTAVHSLYHWFPPRLRGLPSSLYTIGAGLGVFTAAPVLTYLIISHGWRSAFWLLAAVGLAWSVAWLAIGRNGPYSDATHTAQGSAGAPADEALQSPVPYRRLLGSPTWLGGAISGFGAYWAIAVGSAFVPAYLITQHGFSPASAATAVSLYALVIVVGPLVVVPLTGRLHNRGITSRWCRGAAQAVVVLLAGAALLLLPRVTSPVLLYILIAIAFGACAIADPLSFLTTGEVTPMRQRGASLGALLAVQTLPGLVAPAITGWLIDAAPTSGVGYGIAFSVGGVVMLACGLFALLAINPERDARRLGLAGDSAGSGRPQPIGSQPRGRLAK